MINWKIPAGFAGFAILVAFISGAVGSVPLGTILLRAVLSGVIFGGIGFGILFLLKFSLPELYELLSPGENRDPMSGGVDIVISDDSVEDSPPEPLVEEAADSLLSDNAEDEERHVSPSSPQPDELIEEVEEMSSDAVPGSGDEKPQDGGEVISSADDNGAYTELGTIDDTFDKFGDTGGLSDISSSEADTVQILGDFKDPKDVAKAVQTMMKKDEQ